MITGISVGAINGAGMANYEIGHEKEAVDYILSMWQDLSRGDVLKNWDFGGVGRGIFFETGLYDDQPLIDYLYDHVETPKRKYYYGMTDAGSGKYVKHDGTADFDSYIHGLVGSTVFPGIFPVEQGADEGHQYYDGGVIKTVDISSAINYCKAQGFEESQITVDAVSYTHLTLPTIYSV